MTQPFVLYAAPASLYSCKARSYLRQHAIPHIERAPSHPEYLERIMPANGRWIIPVLETPSGEIIQDTVNIIEYLDALVPAERSAIPRSPVHQCVAYLLELFGGEGLLRPAMHYRWDFDETNIPFLSKDFSSMFLIGGDDAAREASFVTSSARMRFATTAFGVSDTNQAAIEASYLEFLQLLDDHLAGSPFLLGGIPTIGDFGFMGPLYAHLARDPYPSVIMKQRAQRVWRWTERMNAPTQDASEYGDYPATLFAHDQIPATMTALLRYISEEFLNDMVAQVNAVESYLVDHPEVLEGEVVLGKPSRRFSGMTSFAWRGETMNVAVVPYRVFMLQRLHQAFHQHDVGAQARIREVFEASGLDPLLDIRPSRWVLRENNREVWGPLQSPSLLG